MLFCRRTPQAEHVTTLVLAYLDDAEIAACAQTSHHALEFVARYYRVDQWGWDGDPRPLPNVSFLTSLLLVRLPDIETHVRFSSLHVISAETVVLYHMQKTNKLAEMTRVRSYMRTLRQAVAANQRVIERHDKELVFQIGPDDLVEAWSGNRDSQMMFVKAYGSFRLEPYRRGVTSLTSRNVLACARQLQNLAYLVRATFVRELPPNADFTYADMLNLSMARRIQSHVNLYMARASPLCSAESVVDFVSAAKLKRVGGILDARGVESALIASIKVVLAQLEPRAYRRRVRGGSFHTFLRRVLQARWKELVLGHAPVVESVTALLSSGACHIEDVMRATSENRLPSLSLIRKVAHGRKDCVCANYCRACEPNNTCSAHESKTLCDRHRLCETCCRACTRA